MLFYRTVPLYIRQDQFIIVQVTLSTPYHSVTSNFMLVFERLHLNLLNIAVLFILQVVFGDHPTRLKTIQTILKLKLSKPTLKETSIFLSQLYVPYKNRIYIRLFIGVCSHLYCQYKMNGNKMTQGKFPKKSPRLGRALPYFSSDQLS